MKVRDVIRLIRSEGWVLVRTRGSHRHFKHPTKPGKVTVAGAPSDDLHPKTLNTILMQAGLRSARESSDRKEPLANNALWFGAIPGFEDEHGRLRTVCVRILFMVVAASESA